MTTIVVGKTYWLKSAKKEVTVALYYPASGIAVVEDKEENQIMTHDSNLTPLDDVREE